MRSVRLPAAPLVALLVTRLATACATIDDDEESTRALRAHPASENLEVVFSEKGGPGGADRVLTVHDTGWLDLKPGHFDVERAQVPRRELDALFQLVKDPAFVVMRSRYVSKTADDFPLASDSLRYRVMVTRGSDVRSVASDGGEEQPALLSRIIDELVRLRRVVEEEGT